MHRSVAHIQVALCQLRHEERGEKYLLVYMRRKIYLHTCGTCAGGPVSYVSYEDLGTPFDEEALLRALAST